MAVNIEDVINDTGFGKFSFKLVLVLSISILADGSEIHLLSLIAPRLKCEWNLSSFQAALMSSSLFLGMGVGALYWGWFSDRYGRKMILIVSATTTFYFGLLIASAPNYLWFLILRFFVGIGVSGTNFIYVYLAEFIPTQYRAKVILVSSISFSAGALYMALIAYLSMNYYGWRLFLLISTLPHSLFLILSPWLPESARYLQNTGDYDGMMKVLHRMSVGNDVKIPNDITIKCQHTDKRGDIFILFHKRYRMKLVIMAIITMSSIGIYYGSTILFAHILQTKPSCGGDGMIFQSTSCRELTDKDYSLNIVVVLGDFPGIMLCLLVVDRIGRKKCVISSFVVMGICFLLLNICLPNEATTVIVFIMKMFASAVHMLSYVYIAELFPTVVRTTALGVASIATRCFLLGVPFLFQNLTHISLLSMAGICLLNILICLLLPETQGQPLLNE